jgi:hypothetical protein
MLDTVRNLGPRQRRRRLVMGVVMTAIGVGLVITLVALGADRGWRLLAVLPFWVGALGLFQAKAET